MTFIDISNRLFVMTTWTNRKWKIWDIGGQLPVFQTIFGFIRQTFIRGAFNEKVLITVNFNTNGLQLCNLYRQKTKTSKDIYYGSRKIKPQDTLRSIRFKKKDYLKAINLKQYFIDYHNKKIIISGFGQRQRFGEVQTKTISLISRIVKPNHLHEVKVYFNKIRSTISLKVTVEVYNEVRAIKDLLHGKVFPQLGFQNILKVESDFAKGWFSERKRHYKANYRVQQEHREPAKSQVGKKIKQGCARFPTFHNASKFLLAEEENDEKLKAKKKTKKPALSSEEVAREILDGVFDKAILEIKRKKLENSPHKCPLCNFRHRTGVLVHRHLLFAHRLSSCKNCTIKPGVIYSLCFDHIYLAKQCIWDV